MPDSPLPPLPPHTHKDAGNFFIKKIIITSWTLTVPKSSVALSWYLKKNQVKIDVSVLLPEVGRVLQKHQVNMIVQ